MDGRATGPIRSRHRAQGQGAEQAPAPQQGLAEPLPAPILPPRPATAWPEPRIRVPGIEDREDVFFAAVALTRMPMILTNPSLTGNPIVFANRAFQELTGYEEAEIIGRNCRFMQGAQTDRDTVAELRAAIVAERPVSVEILNYKRDGTPFWNALFVAPVHDTEGRLLYFFASQLDVTRRHQAEQAFRQAQKMESIGQLTAGLAHDFNNLLQVISGNLEMLKGKLTEDRQRRYAENAGLAAERGAKLTKQLLAFARKTRLSPKVVDVNALLTGFGEMLESTVGRQIELQFNLRRRLPPAHVDPSQLEMALLNVVINARDAMPQGGTITVSTASELVEGNGLPDGRYIVVSVSDDGVGMPDYVRERATEPFFTTKPTGKGTGLGLAMVHGFVQQSLGRLDIESAPGRGTTIRMLFPAGEGTPDAPNPVSPPGREPRAAEAPRGGPETILVVEDSEDVLALAREHLLSLGYRVLVARNADEALEVLDASNQPVDLLFSDILMPGSMNGLMLAERVKERLPEIGVLLTTGYNEELVVEGPRAAAMDVLGKPYRRTELADRIRAALNRRGQETKLPEPQPSIGPRHEA